VDDNEVNLLVAQRMLVAQGCTPILARNGKEAVDLANEQTFDLVLMDCQMPVMDGFSATRELRAMGLKIPILALTASVTEANRSECIQAGMDDLLAKPVSMQQLNRSLAEWMPTTQKQDAF
jgi:CheY-like chemotaxis protein